MRPFGCPVTILNTLDHIRKFDGMADEGFFVGYSLNSKAFRVYNSRKRIVEEKLHIRFSENTLNIVEKKDNVNNTNNVNAAGKNRVNAVGELPFDPDMLALEDVRTFDFLNEDEDDGVMADMNNLDKTIQVLRNKKDGKGIMIRNKVRLVAQGHTQEEGIDYDEVFAPVSRIEAIRLFLAYALFKDFVVYQMDVKSAFLYGKIKKEVYLCQSLGFEDPNFLNRVYKVEKALYRLHQAPRAWYKTLSTYLLDNGFQRGKIDKTLFIKRHKGDILLVQVYVDDIIFDSTRKELCNAFKKLMHEKFQMSSMGELTFFLGLQVKQKNDGIFISQDKYVAKTLKKFGFTKVKNASTPMETQKPLLKDKMEKKYQVKPKVSHLHAVKRIFRYLKDHPKLGLWYLKDSPFDLVAYTDSDYAEASLDRKSSTGGCQFLGSRLISWQLGEGLALPTDPQHTLIILQSSSSQPQKTQKPRKPKRKKTQVPQPSGSTKHVADEAVYKERSDRLVRASTTSFSLEAEQDSGNIDKTQSKATPNEASSLGTTSGGGLRCQESIGDTIAQTRFENVSKLSNDSLLARAKRAIENRNKPPTQAQQRKIMCTYLKNMEGKKLKDLKNTSFDFIQKMFDKAFNRVNTFVDFKTELDEGSSKRA
uniref:Putative ribonuclease H-like domain-containing protein n=1 Tax=Tanacetum cinerariifolium TaxID=118510 RepID=A0A6L2LMP1_TANCI|nr:putative ribonuclease H-like domain-containing protein [Tanacetum cinerariifolium]